MSVLCLVPTPLRAARAARRLCDAEGGVLFGARVLTPDALVPELLAAGGDGRALLSPLAELFLAAEAGRVAGGAFATLEPWDGLAAALAGAIGELRRGEVSAGQARAAAERAGPAGERLALVAQALDAYQLRLRELNALDRPGAFRAAADLLAAGVVSDELRQLDVLVLDGFAALAPAELDLLLSLTRRAVRTHARVPFTPERADLCAPAERFLRALEGMHALPARQELAVSLSPLDAGGERAPRLVAMLAAAGGTVLAPVAPVEGGHVVGLSGAGERGEAEAVANLLARWLGGSPDAGGPGASGPGASRSGTSRLGASGLDATGPDDGRQDDGRQDGGRSARRLDPDEAAVLCGDPARTGPLLARACAELGVPLALGQGTTLAELPPVRSVRAALAAAASPGRAALERLVRSPYLGLARIPAGLAQQLDRAGAIEGRGDPVSALARRAASLTAGEASRERAATTAAAEALSAACEAARVLAGAAPARTHARRLRGFLAAAGARRRAARAELPLALRDLEALARVEEVADDLARSLALAGQGAVSLDTSRWARLLDVALERARLTPAANPEAGAVELWPLSEAPGLAARACVVMGCARGAFPAPGGASPLLRDAEREALRQELGRPALASSGERRGRALHAAFCALAVGREAVALSWPGPGPEGPGAVPAPLAVEALRGAGAEVPDGSDASGASTTSGSARARLARAARAFRAENEARARDPSPAPAPERTIPATQELPSPHAAGRAPADVSPHAAGRAPADVCDLPSPPEGERAPARTRVLPALPVGERAPAQARVLPSPPEGERASARTRVLPSSPEGERGRERGSPPPRTPLPDEEGERLHHALARGALEWERLRTLATGVPGPALGLVPAALTAALAAAWPAEWSPSLLETQARCPYRLFASVPLGLGEPEGGGLDVEPRHEGSLAHAVLERLLRDLGPAWRASPAGRSP